MGDRYVSERCDGLVRVVELGRARRLCHQRVFWQTGHAYSSHGIDLNVTSRLPSIGSTLISLEWDERVDKGEIQDLWHCWQLLIERGITIDGETVPYSPNSTGKNKMRAILDEAMAAVKRVSGHREYSLNDLRALAERELEVLKREGWVVVEPIAKGRFRRTQGLRSVWERTPWAEEREALREHGGPTVRTEEEEAEWRQSGVDELLQNDQPPSG